MALNTIRSNPVIVFSLMGIQLARSGLGNGRQVSHQLVLLDDEMVLGGHLNEAEVAKALHKDADSRTRRADHRGQFFVCNSQLDADAARVFLAMPSGDLQQRL